jgi:O-antigen ligase
MTDITESRQPNSITVQSISTKLTKTNLILSLLIVFVVGTLSAIDPVKAIIAVALLLTILLSFFFTYEVFLIFSLLLLSLGDYFGAKPIALGGFKLYGADYFLVILIILTIKISRPDRTKTKSPLTLLLWIYIIYGFISLLIGLFYQNHELSRTIGDFRRFFYYPISFLLGWNIISKKKDIIKLEKIINFVPFIIIAFAAFRLITGKTWAPEIHTRPEDFRAMPYYDGIALIFIFSYFIALFFARRKLNPIQLVFAFLIPIFIILSGFRLLWGLFILAIMLALWFTFKLRGNCKYLRILVYLFLIIFAALSLFRMAGGKYYEIFETKIVDKILHYELSSERWRYPAWKSAMDKFESSPVLGTSLGDEPTFWVKNSAGQWMKITRTLHNAFLEILYQTGIIGALLFLLIIFKYSVYMYKNLKKLDIDFQPIAVALFILFVSGLIQSLVQPYLNHPGNGVLFFSFMGISLKIVHIVKIEKQKA